ncbi:MAG: hypothetical protein AAB680_03915, partial [Pseudomonadota bacterium]
MHRRSFLSLGSSSLGLAIATNIGIASEVFAAARRPTYGRYGLDLAGRDLNVKPGDDFFRHGGGTWMRTNQIPNDRTRWGVFDQLRAKSEEDVKAIILEVSAKTNASGSVEQKIADFYNSYLDVAAIDAKGIAPLAPELALIDAAQTHDD